MTAPARATHTWRFGVFEVDAQAGELRRAGSPVKLRDQSFRILVVLLENAGSVVTREDLRQTLWSADTFVDFDHSLNAAVMKLREALGDTASKPLYIETIPKHGYRFIAPLVEGGGQAIGAGRGASRDLTPDPPNTLQGIRTKRRGIHVTSLIVAALLSGATWYLLRPSPMPFLTRYIQITDVGHVKYPVAADGNRLYFNEGFYRGPAQVGVTGGGVAPVRIPLPDAYLEDLSPDGSALLVSSGQEGGRRLWIYQMPGGTLRPLVDASIASAAWSPRGDCVAYANAFGEIRLVGSDGTGVRRLVGVGSSVADFNTTGVVWSPDGQRLRFSRKGKLWEVDSDGSHLHMVLPDWRPQWLQLWGRWTPDGRVFLFISQSPGLVARESQLWAVDERRSLLRWRKPEPVQLTFGPIVWDRIAISKDGHSVFSRGSIRLGELVRFDSSSHQLQPFLQGISAEWVTFSPDRRYVAYVTFPEGILWRADADGGNPVRLTDPPLYPLGVRWSPDSRRLLFFTVDQERGTAYVIPAAGGTAERVLPHETAGQIDVNWSADGRQIVYTPLVQSVPGSHRSIATDIRVADLETQKVTVLPGSTGLSYPRWSPNGRCIAALARDSLRAFDLHVQRWSTVYDNSVECPIFSKDGKFLYFLGQPTGIWRASVTGGKPERIVDLNGFRHTGSFSEWMGLDASDRPMLLREMGSDEIYALALQWK